MYCKVIRTANLPGLYLGQVLEIRIFADIVNRALNDKYEMPIAVYHPCA